MSNKNEVQATVTKIEGLILAALYGAYDQEGADHAVEGNLTCHALNVREGEAMFADIAQDIAQAKTLDCALDRAEGWAGMPMVLSALGHSTPLMVLESTIREIFTWAEVK